MAGPRARAWPGEKRRAGRLATVQWPPRVELSGVEVAAHYALQSVEQYLLRWYTVVQGLRQATSQLDVGYQSLVLVARGTGPGGRVCPTDLHELAQAFIVRLDRWAGRTRPEHPGALCLRIGPMIDVGDDDSTDGLGKPAELAKIRMRAHPLRVDQAGEGEFRFVAGDPADLGMVVDEAAPR